MIMLEVCVDSLQSAINAIHGGADELEVCSSLSEGGLTPAPGLVIEIQKMNSNIACKKVIHKTCSQCSCPSLLKKPKVNVMIRCRTGSDFCYTEEEMDTMLSDIEFYKTLHVDKFVFGALTADQEIDEQNCVKILQAAHPIPVTFHRAFDICSDPHSALAKIVHLGFIRLLSSGQKSSAGDMNAIKLLRNLITIYGDKIEIMPGAGVNADNAKEFVNIGCKIIHSSCKRIEQLPSVKNHLTMGTTSSEYIYITDVNIVRRLKEVLSYL
ncbi:unnamed protein product [Parnassius apollo]|uniref:(apollo) hypothetical protein n=1 Tax=Parnassius apollo TaxID=110799 RepID=A0A8S3WMU9_PARAO|nr:unnamed protein product [Parnassius apollo]